jgi:hypothetical protein
MTIIIQNGITDKFYDNFNTSKECNVAKIEALKRDNEITKVRATCTKTKITRITR